MKSEGGYRRIPHVVPDGALCAVFLWGYSMKQTAWILGLKPRDVEKRLRVALFPTWSGR